MQTRSMNILQSVSALTLGGGGLGQLWGATTRAECVATVREAVDGGITLFDLAPPYGRENRSAFLAKPFRADGIPPSG